MACHKITPRQAKMLGLRQQDGAAAKIAEMNPDELNRSDAQGRRH
jgi:hypothetical protein